MIYVRDNTEIANIMHAPDCTEIDNKYLATIQKVISVTRQFLREMVEQAWRARICREALDKCR